MTYSRTVSRRIHPKGKAHLLHGGLRSVFPRFPVAAALRWSLILITTIVTTQQNNKMTGNGNDNSGNDGQFIWIFKMNNNQKFLTRSSSILGAL